MIPPDLERTLRKSNTGLAPEPFTLVLDMTIPSKPRRCVNALMAAFEPLSCAPNWLHGYATTTSLSPKRSLSCLNSS